MSVDDVLETSVEQRARGVRFKQAPHEHGWGIPATLTDHYWSRFSIDQDLRRRS